MKKHLKLRALGIAFVVLAAAVPAPVLASGFYLPWLCAVLVVAAVLGVAWRLMRKGSHD